jgi:hypothetical protein
MRYKFDTPKPINYAATPQAETQEEREEHPSLAMQLGGCLTFSPALQAARPIALKYIRCCLTFSSALQSGTFQLARTKVRDRCQDLSVEENAK